MRVHYATGAVLEACIHKKVFREKGPYYMTVALEGLANSFLFHWVEDPVQRSYEANDPVIRDMFLKGV